MFATWPMVFGALVAGLIAGFLIPEVQQKPAASSAESAKTSESAKNTEPKRALPAQSASTAPAADAKAAEPKAADSAATPEDCERQTWPYLTPNCLDRSGTAPDVVVKTKVAEPKLESASEPKPAPAPAATSKNDSASPVNAGTTSKAAVSPSTESRPTEKQQADKHEADNQQVEKQQNEKQAEKQQPTQAAAQPEKSTRRPPARARAEAHEEPMRSRGERYRDRRYYAGPLDDDDRRPVYIERGGRLYLAPEYHHRLRERDRYWREW